MAVTLPKISFKSKDYFIINKSAGSLSQQADGGELGLQAPLREKNPHCHLLSRIDRPVSGTMIFSLSTKFRTHYLKQQNKGLVRKEYLAIVEGQVEPPQSEFETVTHYFQHHQKSRKAHIFSKENQGKKIELEYKVFYSLDNYTVLLVRLYQGKFHQIRAQLAHIGHPIKGDVKYGARRRNPNRHIHLHSYQISFQDMKSNPVSHHVLPPEEDTLWQIVTEQLQASDK